MSESPSYSIAVIGGGLAGLAAAEAACRHGLRVEVFEQSARLGGRAGSFVEPFGNQLLDFSQHAAMGCCTNFLDFCRRTGVADCFHREKYLHFVGPDNKLREFVPSRWLPAPFHLLTGLKQLTFLAPTERREIVRTLKKLAISHVEKTFGDWLRGQNQSENAVNHFWSVIIHGALSETVEQVSLSSARKVFLDGFLSTRTAGEMILPNLPLAEIFDHRVGKRLTERGITIHRRARVMWIETDENAQLSLVLSEGEVRQFNAVILAVPWHQAASLFPPMLLEELPELSAAQNLIPGSITAVHLWFDRPITPLPHAVLVGKLSQWIFQPSSFPRSRVGTQFRDAPASQEVQEDLESLDHSSDAAITDINVPLPERGNEDHHYYQVVISAAHRLAVMEKETLLDHVLRELAEAFPAANDAQLLHSRVVIQPQAVFSMQPGVERFRPPQTTSIPNLFLAGDWTATGWPATMEGAVRSGYSAVESLLKSLGVPQNILVPDLRRGFFPRRIIS